MTSPSFIRRTLLGMFAKWIKDSLPEEISK